MIDLNYFIQISDKIKKSSKKSYAVLKLSVICIRDINWHSNWFHLLLKKAETSYDNTSYI